MCARMTFLRCMVHAYKYTHYFKFWFRVNFLKTFCDIGRSGIGRSGYWMKWILDEVGIGRSLNGRTGIGRSGNGWNECGRSGNGRSEIEQMGVDELAIGRIGYLTKWVLDQVGIRRSGNGRTGSGRSGNPRARAMISISVNWRYGILIPYINIKIYETLTLLSYSFGISFMLI